MEKEKKFTVKICEDYVVKDPNKVKEILDRASKIISNSYIRMQQEGAS
jgi:competence transcription factor ComK